MNTGGGCIRSQGLANLPRLLRVEVQTRADMRVAERGFRPGQHAKPLTHAKRLLEALPDPGKIYATVLDWSGTFRPQPGCCWGTKYIQCGLGYLSLASRVEQVVNGAQLGGRDPETQNRGALAVRTRLGFVVNNLRLGGDELPKFGHLLL